MESPGAQALGTCGLLAPASPRSPQKASSTVPSPRLQGQRGRSLTWWLRKTRGGEGARLGGPTAEGSAQSKGTSACDGRGQGRTVASPCWGAWSPPTFPGPRVPSVKGTLPRAFCTAVRASRRPPVLSLCFPAGDTEALAVSCPAQGPAPPRGARGEASWGLTHGRAPPPPLPRGPRVSSCHTSSQAPLATVRGACPACRRCHR